MSDISAFVGFLLICLHFLLLFFILLGVMTIARRSLLPKLARRNYSYRQEDGENFLRSSSLKRT